MRRRDTVTATSFAEAPSSQTMDMDLGRANPLLTYVLGILLGGAIVSAYLADEDAAFLINLAFMVAVFALIVLGEVSHRADREG